MIKKILTILIVSVLLLTVVFGTVIYIYRQSIIQYYGEKFIRDNLPEYIKIDKIKFDLVNNVFSINGLRLSNPPGFIAKYMLFIEEVKCVYKIKGRIIPEGLDVKEISFNRPEISVERLPSGNINFVEMDSFIKSFPTKAIPINFSQERNKSSDALNAKASNKMILNRKLSDIIKLPPYFHIERGRIFFIDELPYDKPYEIIVDSVKGDIFLDFNNDYNGILGLNFVLTGILNKDPDQRLKWTASLDPKTPKLTMSNRFEVSDLNILTFEPYYQSYSPIIFRKGNFSGDLVFDFNNGEIGSTNTIQLSGISFFVKEGAEKNQFFETSVPDLVKYFTTPTGDVVFDFKIKGDMKNPKFYLGPISKRALTSMAIDKISSYAIKQVSKPAAAATNGTVDKAQDYIDMFRQIVNKK